MAYDPCPHCGGNTAEGAAVRRGEWWLTKVGTFYGGEQITLPRAQSRILYLIARANGKPITHADIPGCAAGTLTNHLRGLRRALGGRFPVRGVSGRGYAWAGGE